MSKKYVDVDEMKERIHCNDPELPDYKTLITFIDSLPEADVAPVVHGKWIDNKGLYQCSVCNHIWSELWWTLSCPIDRMNKMMHYCPKCGAKMDANKKEIEEE